jgi:nucleotide-binding universal stress UspA family protein
MGFDRVLVPLDGTPESRAILAYLPRLLASPRAEVLLTRAIPFLSTVLELPMGMAAGPSFLASDTSEVEAQVSSVVRKLRARGVRARDITRIGDDVDLIRQVIRKEAPTLIALSQRPSEGFWPLASGTLAERLVRATTLPLFVVNVFGSSRKGTEGGPDSHDPITILVPLAGSSGAADAVELAARLVRTGGGSLRVEALVDADASLAETLSATARGLTHCLQQHIPARKEMVRGDPARVLLEEAQGKSADLLVLSPRLLPGESSDPLGGLVAGVLRRSRVPVVVTGRRGKGARPERTPTGNGHRTRLSFEFPVADHPLNKKESL